MNFNAGWEKEGPLVLLIGNSTQRTHYFPSKLLVLCFIVSEPSWNHNIHNAFHEGSTEELIGNM